MACNLLLAAGADRQRHSPHLHHQAVAAYIRTRVFDLAPVVFQPIAHSYIPCSGTRVSEMPQYTRFMRFCMDGVRGFYIGTEPRQPSRMTRPPYCQMTSTASGSATHATDVIGQIGSNDHVRLNNPFERVPKMSLGRFPGRATMA